MRENQRFSNSGFRDRKKRWRERVEDEEEDR